MKDDKKNFYLDENGNLHGVSGGWYQDASIGGYFDKSGRLVVCEEYGTPQQLGKNDIDVINGNGYYDEQGYYHAYNLYD